MQDSGRNLIDFNETTPKFGVVALGKTTDPKIISISNVSGAPIYILQIQSTDDFEQSNRCPKWLAEGSSCLIYVSFKPTASGPRSGSLFVDAAPYGPGRTTISSQRIYLIGFGLGSANGSDVPDSTFKSRTENDEERALKLLQDKNYPFEELLKGNPSAIANSEKIFKLTRETDRKLRIASILLSIHVPNQIYSDYLSGEAEKALAHDHDIPWPLLYAKGQDSSNEPNPAFVAWCQARGLAFSDMYGVSESEIPNAWYFLAAAGDPRSYDLLRQGLHSPNLAIAGDAARGLAKLQDPRIINELISAAHDSSGEARYGIADALLFFNTPEAQAVAEELLPSKNLLAIKKREIAAKGVKALFPW